MSNLEGVMTVETTDVMSSAVREAMVRINHVPKSLTLVDNISKEGWKTWDASQELALLADSESLVEEYGDDVPSKAA